MSVIEMALAERLSRVGEYYFSKKLKEIEILKSEGKDIISLGIGSPDLPAPKAAIDTLAESSLDPSVHGYQPYGGTIELRRAFAEWYDRCYGVTLDPATEVLPLIGSKEGIMHCCMTYLSKGDKVLIPNPGYPTYAAAVSLAGGEAVGYKLTEENGYHIDLEKIEKDGIDGVKMLICNYPHMPTGSHASTELFEEIIAFGRRNNILIIHDNPYSFVRNDKPQSILSIEGAKDCAIELNSLSKSHNMAGWRIGAVSGAKERISEILRFKSNMDSGIFRPMQMAAVTALSLGDEWFSELNATYREREIVGLKIMEKLGCKVAPNQAGLFIWGRLPEDCVGCYEFIDKILHEKSVFITPGAIFGSEGDRYIRISLCAPKERLQEALERL